MHTIGIIVTTVILAAPVGAPSEMGGPDSVWTLVDASAATEDEGDRNRILREAEALARGRLAGHESDLERHYALAVVLGLRANVEGGKTKVRVATELSDELALILARDPEHAGARHMLGRLHAGVRRMGRLTRWIATNLLGGDELDSASWEAAEENLLFAERRAPEIADHHLQLALLYRDTDRPQMAVQELGHVMELQASTAMDLAVQREAMEVWADLQQ